MGMSSGEFYQHFYKDKHLKRYFFIPNDLSSVVRELKIDCVKTISVLEDLKILNLKHERIRYKEFVYDMYINIFGCTS